MTQNTNAGMELNLESTSAYEDDVDVNEGSTPEPQKFSRNLKVNGEEKLYEFNEEELTAILQKGINYDKKTSELESLKNSNMMKTLGDLAKEENLKLEDYVQAIKDSKMSHRIESRSKELEAEGIKPELALKYAKLEIEQTPQKVNDDPMEKAFLELYQEFPETKDLKDLNDYPPEVVEAIQQGKNPIVAYSKWKVSEAQKAVVVDATNKANQVKDTGSLTTKDSGKKVDDILQGFRGL